MSFNYYIRAVVKNKEIEYSKLLQLFINIYTIFKLFLSLF